jgi:hypothetical protein
MVVLSGLAFALVAAPSSARAQNPGDFEKRVRKCDATIQKEALKFKGDLAKRLGKCMDQTRLEIFKEAKGSTADFAKRAQKCEDQLDKALGFSNPAGTDSKLAKFRDVEDVRSFELACGGEPYGTPDAGHPDRPRDEQRLAIL